MNRLSTAMHPALIEPLESRIAPASLISIAPPSTSQISEGPAGGMATLVFTVSLDTPAEADVTVDVVAVDGTASSGSDYTYATQAVTILAGQTTTTTSIEVTVNGDTSFELNETFALKIQNLITNGADVSLGTDTASATIENDDSTPTVDILNASHPEGNAADNPFGFTVRLSEAAGVDVKVQIATSTNGSADVSDFDQIDQEFTVPAGQTEATFFVNVKGDTTAEGEETFLATMTNPVNATLGIAQATGTILEDDATIFSVDDITVSESGTAVFKVKLSQAQAGAVTIKYRTTDGSAEAGTLATGGDYTAADAELTFAAGVTEMDVTIALVNDGIFENTENFRLILSDPSVGTVPDAEATATITDDDNPPVLTIRGPDNQVSPVAIDEGNSLRGNVFTLTLDHASSSEIIVHLSTGGGSATSGTDFTAIDQDITFAPGETSKTITLFVNGDTVDELNETLTLTVTPSSGNVVLPASPTTVVLRNDDVRITVADVQVEEGNSGTKQMVFMVTLNQASDHVVSLDYATADGTASAADYTGITVPQTLTFAPGETSKMITIDITGDVSGETDEFFTVNFTNVADATINQTSVRGTISDDDPFLSIGNAQVFEGTTNTTRTMVFTVSLLRAPGAGTVTMNYTTSPVSTTAVESATGDYLDATGSLSFAPGETTKTISVTVRGDVEAEADETFLVTLSDVAGIDPAALGALTATGTIIDDEGLVTASNATIVEGDAGTANMVFVLTLNRSSGNTAAVKVNYATVDGTAISVGALADYAVTSGTITFATGETQKTVSVPIRGDLLREGDQTFQLNLSVDNTGVAVANQASMATPTVIGTIVDNDPLPSFSITGGSVIEGSSGAAVVFTINLTGGSETPVLVNFATQAGTATAADFTASGTQLVFTPGQTSATISVPVTDDGLVEGDETFTMVLSNAVGATIGTSTATGTIRDNEIVVTLEAFDFAGPVAEGNNGTSLKQMKVKLSQAPIASKPVVVGFTVAGVSATAGADFVLLNSTNFVTFNVGETEKTIDFNIVGDTLDEAETVTEGGQPVTKDQESFTVTLTGASNAVILAPEAGKTAIIQDDDSGPTISIDDAQVTEGDTGTTTMNFTVRLSQPSAQTVTVVATPNVGTATASDFTTAANTITFSPGQTEKTFSVTILNDTIDEPTETMTVTLSAPSNATITDNSALGTIFDNDTRTLSIADAVIAEGDSGTTTLTFKVRLSAVSAQIVTIDYLTVNGTALSGSDYVANTGTLTFAAGDVEEDIVITINGDTALEGDETFLVRLQPNADEPVNATVLDSEATGTIKNDELKFTFGAAPAGVVEEGAQSGQGNTITFTINRTGDLTQAATVSYTTVAGTAVAGKDFTPITGTVNFAAGDESKTVTVTLVNDQSFEADENFSLRLTGTTNGVIVDGLGAVRPTLDQVATILGGPGSDARPTVEISDASVVEGNDPNVPATLTFTVKLRAGGQDAANEVEDTTFTYHTVAGTARDVDTASGLFAKDFNKVISQSLTFAKGETSKTFTVQIVGDSVDEHDETFTVVIDSATVGTDDPDTEDVDERTPVTITDGTGIGTITDNDIAPVVTIADLSVLEGSLGNFTINPKLELKVETGGASTHSEKDIVLTVTTVAGTATLGTDFLGPITRTVTIPAGTTSLDLDYTIIGDNVREADETFTILLSDPQNVRLGDGGAKVTIKNGVADTDVDFDPVPKLSIGNVTVIEGDSGTSQMIFTVSLEGATDQLVTVNFTTANGTARSGGGLPDYLATSGSLSFATGETTKTITVTIFGDTWAEVDETLSVTLSGAANATFLGGGTSVSGTGTIQNGGDTVIGLVVNDVVSLENQFELNTDGSLKLDSKGNPIPVAAADAKVLFNVELTKALDTALTFGVQTRNGTAISNGTDADYTALASSFTINAGSTSVNVPVSIIGDTTFEATESFFLAVGNISNSAVLEARGEGRGVLLNDDFIFVDNKTLRYVDEDGDMATVRITKGNLGAATLSFGPINPQTGGRVLQLLDFTPSPTQFNGTSVNISAEPQTGFAVTGLPTDGHVDVGYIKGATPDTNTLQFTSGIDFTNVTVEGDLGKITAGDLITTPSIAGKLSVHSIGTRGLDTLPGDEIFRNAAGNITGFNNVSAFLSTVNSIEVSGDVMGVLQVIGSQYGSIKSLRIDGALRGDAAPDFDSVNSGIVFFTGSLGKAIIGDIIGGAASNSGVVNGNTAYTAKIGTLHVLGDIIGGTGQNSGRIVAKTIGSVVVDGDLVGNGVETGQIFATSALTSVKIAGDVKGGAQRTSGTVTSGGVLGTLHIGGSLIGNTGDDSGVIIATRALTNAAIAGDIIGGGGERSGSVQVGRGSDAAAVGTITKLVVGTTGGTGGNVIGGTGEDSGTISAGARLIDTNTDGLGDDLVIFGGSISNVLLYGDLVGGRGQGSGGVQTGGAMAKLDIRGDLIGGDSQAIGADTAATVLLQSGFVVGGKLATMTLGGDLRAGTNFGSGIADSGVIRMHDTIGSLTIYGNVVGNETNRAIISAGSNGPTVTGPTGVKTLTPAIKTLTVGKSVTTGTTTNVTGGIVSFLDVLAGYDAQGAVAEPRGVGRSADAQIGTVNFRTSMQATNIVAGMDAGADNLFGTIDDAVLVGTTEAPVINNATVISSIAKVIVGSTKAGAPDSILAHDDDHGIVAQLVSSIVANNLANDFALFPKAGNDFSEISSGTNVYVNEKV